MPRSRGLGELPADVRRQLALPSVGEGGTPGAAPAAMRTAYPFRPRRFVTAAGSKLCLNGWNGRRYLLIENQSGVLLTMNFGAAATANDKQIPAGTGFEWYVVIPSDSIFVWCAGAGNRFLLIEA